MRKIVLALGGGLGLALLILTGWLAFRRFGPFPSPWLTTAIVASFESVDTEPPESTLVFTYVFANNTDRDYTLEQASGIKVMAQRTDPSSLAAGDDGFPKVSMPAFIPAHERTRVNVYLGKAYYIDQRPRPKRTAKPEDIVGMFTSDDLGRSLYPKANAELLQSIREGLPRLEGFTIFDEKHRYQIELPKGW
jgi:hypothetical protein